MPKLSGYELTQLIRERPELEDVPLIAVSGYADDQHAAKALEAGCDHYLFKPLDFKQLNRIIDGEIERREPGLDGFFFKV